MYPTHQRIINAIWRKKRDRFWYTRKTRTIDPLLYSPNGSLAPYHYPNHRQDLPALQTTSSRTCVPALERNVDVIAASLSLPTSGYPRRVCGQKGPPLPRCHTPRPRGLRSSARAVCLCGPTAWMPLLLPSLKFSLPFKRASLALWGMGGLSRRLCSLCSLEEVLLHVALCIRPSRHLGLRR